MLALWLCCSGFADSDFATTTLRGHRLRDAPPEAALLSLCRLLSAATFAHLGLAPLALHEALRRQALLKALVGWAI